MLTIPDQHKQKLDEEGYLVIEDFFDDELRLALRRRIDALYEEEGERAGWEFRQEPGCRRLANLIDKGEIFRQTIMRPDLLAYIDYVLGGSYKLSSLNARSVNPRSQTRQPLHADQSAVIDERGRWVCNSVWMLDDYTAENGALRVVPGSHKWRKLPQEVLADPMAPHPDEVMVTGRAGSLCIMHHLWHGGLANSTDKPRVAMLGFFVRRDKPQQTYQKQYIGPEVQAQLSPELRHLLALDDLHNDALARDSSPRSGFLK